MEQTRVTHPWILKQINRNFRSLRMFLTELISTLSSHVFYTVAVHTSAKFETFIYCRRESAVWSTCHIAIWGIDVAFTCSNRSIKCNKLEPCDQCLPQDPPQHGRRGSFDLWLWSGMSLKRSVLMDRTHTSRTIRSTFMCSNRLF